MFLWFGAFARRYGTQCQARHYTKEAISPLTKHLIDSIKITGPMTVAHYMRQVLVNPLSGYYMQGDVFGSEGDFVTSPEISQMFGELAGVWYLTEWMRFGKPSRTQIVECGPGRGTLMTDMLRAMSRFPSFYETISAVHLIEASPGLRKMQKNALLDGSDNTADDTLVESATRADGIRICWHDGIELVPEEWSFVMAHEFFDALPIHSFEKTEDGWRELLVDIDQDEERESNLGLVRSPSPTTASKAFMADERFSNFKPGDRIEISPDSWYVMDKMAKLVQTKGGTGLVIDYGQDHTQGDTLRAIRKHQIVHPMSNPGSADISADVDFSMLREAIAKVPSIAAHGPVTQSQFLQSLGIQLRMETLVKNAKTKESRHNIIHGFQRLLDPAQMGRIYKVLAFANENGQSTTDKPVGFQVNCL